MSTKFQSEEITANLYYKDLFKKFTDLNNLKGYLPKEVKEFESSTNNCSFKIEQSPKISLQLTEKIAYSQIKFESNESQIPFEMNCYLKKNDNNTTNVILEINMEVNFMTKMLVQKPINIFLEKFTDIIKKI
tara:strand:- start:286 stop:681 length:396 start_codon:yes stop_codon:yes gene_type:complete